MEKTSARDSAATPCSPVATTRPTRFDPLHYEDGMIECSTGDYVEWTVFEQCNRERLQLTDVVNRLREALECIASDDFDARRRAHDALAVL